MAQVAAPPVQGFALDDVAPREVATPIGEVSSGGSVGVRARLRASQIEPLLHVAVVATALAALWPAGVRPTLGVMLALLLGWPALLAAHGLYGGSPLAAPGDRLRMVVRAGMALGAACWVAAAALSAVAADSLVPTVAAVLTATLVVTALPALVARRERRLVVAGGADELARALPELVRGSRRCTVVASCVIRPDGSFELADVATGGRLGVADPLELAAGTGADAVVVLPGTDLTPTALRRLEWGAARRGVDLCVGTPLLDVTPSRTATYRIGGMDVLHVRPAVLRGPRRVAKDLVERLVALGALLVLLPLLLTVAIAVRRDTPGPALFRQQRVSKSGRLFTMYKFRTMSCTAEEDLAGLKGGNDADGVLFKLRLDPRVTRIGGFLRKYSIDELPQLWNVATGQMSLVGPRPALPEEVERYDLDPRRRLAVKPGLTGLWQVSGRSDLSWEESVRLDLQYVDNWSLHLDATILWRTVGAVLSHRGAY